MYNERKENFSIRDVALQILFVLLFIFLLLWLFPTKGYVDDAIKPLKETRVDSSVFSENVKMMNEAAEDYFTTARLPQEVGKKETITLGEMFEKKLILPFVDSQGMQCDTNNSYVEVTKMDNEYTMKVNLKCPDNEDYIIVHKGCYGYCDVEEEDTKPVSNTKPKPIPKPTPNKPTPPPTPTPVTYSYEYVKVTADTYSDWSAWSNWVTKKVNKDNLTDVKSKTETTYSQTWGVVSYNTKTEQVPVYENRQVLETTQIEKVCTSYKTEYVSIGDYKYTDWVKQGEQVIYGTPPSNTDLKQYIEIAGTSGVYDCGDCTSSTYATYVIYTRTKYEVKEPEVQCATYDIKETPIYINKRVFVGYETKTTYQPIYGYETVRNDTVYYSYRTRHFIKGTSTTKWSYFNDKNLLNNGYDYTGEKVVKK